MNKQFHARTIMWVCAILSLAMVAAYVLISSGDPFSTSINPSAEITWNDFWLNCITVAAALFCAWAATRVARSYKKGEPPLGIWWSFAFGLWAWFLAEFSWSAYNLTMGDVPVPSIADWLWVIGFIAFSFSFSRQYHLIYKPSRKKRYFIVGLIWLAVILLTALVTLIATGSVPVSGLINFFYPVADLAVAVVALIFMYLFGRGAMMRPWMGLFIFALSDITYAVLYETGIYAYTSTTSNVASILTDALYVAAYLMLGLGVLSHSFLLKYGPGVFRSKKPN